MLGRVFLFKVGHKRYLEASFGREGWKQGSSHWFLCSEGWGQCFCASQPLPCVCLPCLDLLLIYTPLDPPSAALTPGPDVFSSMIAFASSRLQAVRMTLIPINSEGLQAAFPADFKLQLQTPRQQPYRDCQISSHNGIRPNPQNKLFTDTYIIVYTYATQIHTYIQTCISI